LASIDRLQCGHYVVVANEFCDPAWWYYIGVRISDHGPNPRLVCGIDQACGYYGLNRFIDLTRSAFVGAGGNLAQGLLMVYVHT
jgi:hypothetical protein